MESRDGQDEVAGAGEAEGEEGVEEAEGNEEAVGDGEPPLRRLAELSFYCFSKTSTLLTF